MIFDLLNIAALAIGGACAGASIWWALRRER
jgi:hypothetical protein